MPSESPEQQSSKASDQRSTQRSGYVLVTPVRNEEKFVGRTIQSVLKQSILPREWIIVSDGSTDKTDSIIEAAIQKNAWIQLIKLPQREQPSFAAVVENTTFGINKLSIEDYDFIGLLDSDLEFQEDYFEKLINEFTMSSKLGLAGGVAIDIGLPKNIFPRNRQDVPGALQFFRRQCFESFDGLIAIPEGGWDSLTCAQARMQGWKTKLVTSLIVDHLKPRNISQGGTLKRKWQMGVRDSALGYHPVFEFLKCLNRFSDSPILLGALSWWLGYCIAAFKGRSQIIPEQIVSFVRKEQIERLKKTFALSNR